MKRWLLFLLRLLVGAAAGLVALAALITVLTRPLTDLTEHWSEMLGFYGLGLLIFAFCAALAYGLLFMRHWVIYVNRVVLGGVLVVYLIVLCALERYSLVEVLTSEDWVWPNLVILVFVLLEVLLRKNARWLTHGEA